MHFSPLSCFTLLILSLIACGPSDEGGPEDTLGIDLAKNDPRVRPDIYVPVQLTADLGLLNEDQRRMVPLLIEVAQIMDQLFWQEAWGSADSLPIDQPAIDTKRFFSMNYGPWDRLKGDAPFIDGVGAKPKGARFYPADMSETEFDAWADSSKKSQYTMVRRNASGNLTAIPYHVFFNAPIEHAASLLEQAAQLAHDEGLRTYLLARAQALRTDRYDASDIAWLDMRTNVIDVIAGPIETYEDRLYGYKASHECYVLLKDLAWSTRLERFAKLLPVLQRGLPVPEKYKREKPGSDSQLGAYDAIYYAGAANAGGKTIAVNLPNDEGIQLSKGTRRLQLKNVMRSKFNKILMPLADLLVAEDQRKHITFDAFFENVMFHEVAHGLGIKNTVDGRGLVRDALREEAGAIEEGKADILGLYMVEQLREKKEITDGDLMDNYVTFMASIFRSVRFGASDAHGRANMLRFNFFMQAGAFVRDEATGTYRVDQEKMHDAIADLSSLIVQLQGDGDIDRARTLMKEQAVIGPVLRKDLDRLKAAKVPVDVVFEQGLKVLGPISAR